MKAPGKVWMGDGADFEAYGVSMSGDTEYIRADIAERAIVLAVEAETAKLREFAREIILTYCWNLGDPKAERQFDTDGGHIQDLAEKLELIEPHKATAEFDYDESYFDIGDTVFIFTAALSPEKPEEKTEKKGG